MFLIDKVIKRFLDIKYNLRPIVATVLKKPLIFCLPFLWHNSLQLKRSLSKLLDRAYPHIEVPWVPEPQNLHERELVREKERRKKGGSGQMITQSCFGADQRDYESIRSPFVR